MTMASSFSFLSSSFAGGCEMAIGTHRPSSTGTRTGSTWFVQYCDVFFLYEMLARAKLKEDSKFVELKIALEPRLNR